MKFLNILLCATTFFCGGLAVAQTTAPAPDSLYFALGAKAGIEKLANDFVDRLRANPRVGPAFKDTKPAFLKKQIADQFCQLSGGPCVYDGETMAKAHGSLKTNAGDFNTVVELLQDSMDAQSIPFGTQNKLLALLAPMHRDIVNAK
jgi:hemoglobin